MEASEQVVISAQQASTICALFNREGETVALSHKANWSSWDLHQAAPTPQTFPRLPPSQPGPHCDPHLVTICEWGEEPAGVPGSQGPGLPPHRPRASQPHTSRVGVLMSTGSITVNTFRARRAGTQGRCRVALMQ